MNILTQKNIKHKLESGQDLFSLSTRKQNIYEITFSRYVGEVLLLGEKPMVSFNNKLVDCPPNTGKTKTVVEQLLQDKDYVLIVADTLALAKQLSMIYSLPVHSADNLLSPDTPKLITVYNWINYFHPNGIAKHTVVIDEAHSLVSQQSFRPDTLELVADSLALYPEVYCLTGTYIDSKFFDDYLIIKGTPTDLKQQELHFVRYKNPFETVAELAYQFSQQDHRIMIYLPNKGKKLAWMKEALSQRGIYSISELNANTIHADDDLLFETGNEIVEKQSFDSQVLLTTYTQGYNLENKDVVFIAFPGTDFVSVTQAIMRLRDGSKYNFLLTNATDEELDFKTTYDALYNYWELQAKALYSQMLKAKNNSRAIRAIKNSSSAKDLIYDSLDINHLKIAYYAYNDIVQACETDLKLLTTAFESLDISVNKTYNFEANKVSLDLVNLTDTSWAKTVEQTYNKLATNELLSQDEKKVRSKIRELSEWLDPEDVKDYLLNVYTPKTYKKYKAKLAMQAIDSNTVEGRFRDTVKESLDFSKRYTSPELHDIVKNASKVTGYELEKDWFVDLKLVVNVTRIDSWVEGKKLLTYHVFC